MYKFPSPCGDYGSYRANHGAYGETRQFPSPCGDYGSYLMKQVSIDEARKAVSVPLRGLWFLSCSECCEFL